MRVTLIDASPKVQKSTSGQILNILKDNFENTANVCEMKLHTQYLSEEQKIAIQETDSAVFAFPLYVDGVPGHLLSCLVQMEKEQLVKPGSVVYGIVNCGFYEGIQTKTALWVLENWCDKIGACWGGGLGIGGGGAMAYMPVSGSGKGPMAAVSKELHVLAENVKTSNIGENHFTQLKLTRFLYKLAGQMGWRSTIKNNGLSISDLNRKL